MVNQTVLIFPETNPGNNELRISDKTSDSRWLLLILSKIPEIIASNDAAIAAPGFNKGIARIDFEFTAVAIDEVLPKLE